MSEEKITRERKGRVIPLGYKVSQEDEKLLIQIPEHMEMIDKAKDIFGNDYTDKDSYLGYFMRNPQDLQLLIDSDWDMNKFIMAK